MIALETRQQLGFQGYVIKVKVAEKLANECYYMSLKMLPKQNDKTT